MGHETLLPPSRERVLLRSLGYGWLAGGVYGALWGGFIGFVDSGVAGLPLAFVGFLIGATIGSINGLLMGGVVLALRDSLRRSPRRLQLLVSLASMVVVFVALWILTGDAPFSVYALLFVVPAALAAWVLLPVVLRPQRQKPTPRLPGGKSDQ